jgi:mitochondrial fission protein ELM1
MPAIDGVPANDAVPSPRTWLILGQRAGDNAQVRALARALGWPAEVKQIHYDEAETTGFKDRGASLIGVDRTASASLEAPWPELIIAIGRRSAPVVRWIRDQARQAGTATLLVHLGRPRVDLDLFDLIVTTPQYNLPPGPNVMELSLPIVFVDAAELGRAAAAWHERFASLPRPWHAVLVGGPTPQLAFGSEEAGRLLSELTAWQARHGGGLLITTSPRTPPVVTDTLRASLRASRQHLLFPFAAGGDNPYLALLALADDFVVTVDSASMVAQAASRRKPIYLFDLPKLEPTRKPGLKAALSGSWRRRRQERRDAGLDADLGDRLYDLWTRRGKARPRRDIGKLSKRLVETGIAVPLGSEPLGSETPPLAEPGADHEVAAVLARIRALWQTRSRSRLQDDSPGTGTRNP